MTAFAPFAVLPFATLPGAAALPALPAPSEDAPLAARTAAEILAELLDLLPRGWAWSRAPDTVLAQLLLPTAEELARFEASAEAMLPQVNPRQATDLLADYERVLGPDPCGRDLVEAAGGTDDRQRSAHQRWIASGFQTPAYFVALAAALGVAATVTEILPAVLGPAECGMELAPADERFVWVVALPETRVIEPELGVLECGGFLGEIVPSLVECVIRRLAPAHTTPVFSYTET